MFLRKLLDGSNATYPKPKSFKLTKNQLFQDKDTVYDYVYDKRNNGTWISWMELEKEVPLAPNMKVLCIKLSLQSMNLYFHNNILNSK